MSSITQCQLISANISAHDLPAERKNKRTDPRQKVGLGKKLPTLSKFVHRIRIVLLFLEGLCGSGGIFSKKCA